MNAQLFVQLQGETVRWLTLDMLLLSIGRTPDNGLPLPHPSVEIRHAEIRRDGARFLITDLGGDSFLGGRRLAPHQPQLLEEGAVVQIGPYVITFTAQAAAPVAPARQPTQETLPELRALPLRPPRAKHAPPRLAGHASSYLNYLPAMFAESDFAGRYLRIFESVWEPLQQRQDHLHLYFDPATCPEPVLNWLSEWLGLSVDPHWPEARRREWLQQAINLYRWRGTRYGLTRLLEVCCGVNAHIAEDPARPFQLLIYLPDLQGDHEEFSRSDLEQVIAQHVPAHVMYEVRYV